MGFFPAYLRVVCVVVRAVLLGLCVRPPVAGLFCAELVLCVLAVRLKGARRVVVRLLDEVFLWLLFSISNVSRIFFQYPERAQVIANVINC